MQNQLPNLEEVPPTLPTPATDGDSPKKSKRSQSAKSKALVGSILSLDELETLQIPERRALVPWLAEGGMVMIYGPRGIGKTYLSLSLALCLCSGQEFLKWAVKAPSGVLMVDGEMSLADLRNRIFDLKLGQAKMPFQVLSHEHYFSLSEADLDLGNKECQDALMTYLEENPDIRVVILDNLSSLFPRLREDKRDDWVTLALPFLLWLRRRGIATILIHHAGKGGDQRGTSSREDALDTVIQLDRASDNSEGANFVLRFTKSRNCFGEDVADIEATLHPDTEGPPYWTWKPVEDSNEERLLRLVAEGVDNVTDAAEELGITKGAVSKIKKRLQDQFKLNLGTKKLVLTPPPIT